MLKLKIWTLAGNAWESTEGPEAKSMEEAQLYAKTIIDYVNVHVDDMAVEVLDTETGTRRRMIFGQAIAEGRNRLGELLDEIVGKIREGGQG